MATGTQSAPRYRGAEERFRRAIRFSETLRGELEPVGKWSPELANVLAPAHANERWAIAPDALVTALFVVITTLHQELPADMKKHVTPYQSAIESFLDITAGLANAERKALIDRLGDDATTVADTLGWN